MFDPSVKRSTKDSIKFSSNSELSEEFWTIIGKTIKYAAAAACADVLRRAAVRHLYLHINYCVQTMAPACSSRSPYSEQPKELLLIPVRLAHVDLRRATAAEARSLELLRVHGARVAPHLHVGACAEGASTRRGGRGFNAWLWSCWGRVHGAAAGATWIVRGRDAVEITSLVHQPVLRFCSSAVLCHRSCSRAVSHAGAGGSLHALLHSCRRSGDRLGYEAPRASSRTVRVLELPTTSQAPNELAVLRSCSLAPRLASSRRRRGFAVLRFSGPTAVGLAHEASAGAKKSSGSAVLRSCSLTSHVRRRRSTGSAVLQFSGQKKETA